MRNGNQIRFTNIPQEKQPMDIWDNHMLSLQDIKNVGIIHICGTRVIFLHFFFPKTLNRSNDKFNIV